MSVTPSNAHLLPELKKKKKKDPYNSVPVNFFDHIIVSYILHVEVL